jgi:hypothetical protein
MQKHDSCHPVQGNWSLFIPRAERIRELSGHLLRSLQSLRGFHRGFQKGFHFQNESCDCIKYLNLGDELGYDVELVYKKKQVDMQNA